MPPQLIEMPLYPMPGPIPETVATFIDEGLRRSKPIDCFDFVPCDYPTLYTALAAANRGRFCEWGSGMGIGIGLAEMLGFDSLGIEIDAAMATASRELLRDFGLSARVETGSYFELQRDADIYFSYCWPGQLARVEDRFASAAPESSQLWTYYSAGDIRGKVKREAPS